MTEYFFTWVLVSALGWLVGAIIARWIINRLSSKNEAEESDDLLDFDKADKPYIPVRIMKENGMYYAWFSGNDMFIGQSKKIEDIRRMAHENVFKQMGLRFEFAEETSKVKPKLEKNP